MKNLVGWIQQPSSVAGISAIVGTVGAIILHHITLAQAIPLLAGALVSIALPDNSAAKADTERLASALLAQSKANVPSK